MITKAIVDEDFVNYKKPSMFIAFPTCGWKCEKECGKRVCQNSALAEAPNIDIDVEAIVDRYINNPITRAVVIGGLEPFDSFAYLIDLVMAIRKETDDDIVIYTGYTKDELIKGKYMKLYIDLSGSGSTKMKLNFYNYLKNNVKNIIIKYGRYVPGQQQHYDDVLGVYLASNNQYAEKIS